MLLQAGSLKSQQVLRMCAVHRDEPPVESATISAAASPSKSKIPDSSIIVGLPTAGGADKRKRLGGAAEQVQRREHLARRTAMGCAGKGGVDPLDPSSYSDAPRCECDADFVPRPGLGSAMKFETETGGCLLLVSFLVSRCLSAARCCFQVHACARRYLLCSSCAEDLLGAAECGVVVQRNNATPGPLPKEVSQPET